MIQIGAKRTMERLEEMLDDAMDGTFEEERYDETRLSRLEARWKQYFTSQEQAVAKTRKERENMRALVSDISHQTKTPLANILLYAELLEEKAENAEEKALAAQILKQTEKLEFLIRALVKMSRLETGILKVEPVRQKLSPMVLEAADMLKKKAKDKGVHLTVSCDRDVVCCFDRKWTSEALENIIDNGVKYSPEGSRLRVQVREYELYVCVEVEDQGPGIPEEERAQIFGRFYRGKKVQQEEGVGIGLYLAREILEKEGGYIKVSSGREAGSVFSLYLPKEANESVRTDRL
nr:HAMP domain-containing sensor histidine kinase [uncultured Merdimonas sp.]